MASLVVVVLVLGLTGCGGAPGEIGPSGVDELTIPTPSPDPADFGDAIDNQWLPLPDGATWTYRTEVAGPGEAASIDMEVTGPGPTIAGVRTMAVQVTPRSSSGRPLGSSASWYAQDLDGNVWLLGEEHPDGDESWRAASDGAEAGVAMPASPRLGDGFWRARVPGLTDQQVRVRSVSETLEVASGELSHVVVLELIVDDASTTRWYAPGVGLVAMEISGRRFTLAGSSLTPEATA